MRIELIEQSLINDPDQMMKTVTISQVNRSCILTRLMVDILGRPGKNNDMKFFGSGDRWTMRWTYPKLSLEEVQQLMTHIIYSSPTSQ